MRKVNGLSLGACAFVHLVSPVEGGLQPKVSTAAGPLGSGLANLAQSRRFIPSMVTNEINTHAA